MLKDAVLTHSKIVKWTVHPEEQDPSDVRMYAGRISLTGERKGSKGENLDVDGGIKFYDRFLFAYILHYQWSPVFKICIQVI